MNRHLGRLWRLVRPLRTFLIFAGILAAWPLFQGLWLLGLLYLSLRYVIWPRLARLWRGA